MERRRIIAWIALILFIAIVVNILFIHVYVTESVIVFICYALFFFFVYNKDSFLNSSVNTQDNEILEGNDVLEDRDVLKDNDTSKDNEG